MFLAMNRFCIRPGQEDAFEAIWKSRESRLPEVPGFVSFNLLRGPVKDDHVLYASHTIWKDEQSFRNWTRSDAFRAAHRGAGSHGEIYAGHPELELFSSVQQIES